jgi:cytochrome c-type biogenesis protein CcmE
VFHADEVLAKHDENYMPPTAADALRKAQQVNLRTGNMHLKPEVQNR